MIKEFETPTIEVIKIEVQDIIATSPSDLDQDEITAG